MERYMSGITKRVSCHNFGICLPPTARGRPDIRTVQEVLGHRDVSTTMVYRHVLNLGLLGVRVRRIGSSCRRRACGRKSNRSDARRLRRLTDGCGPNGPSVGSLGPVRASARSTG